MQRALALLGLLIATASQAAGPTGSIDDFIALEMPIAGAPGLAYAIVEDGEIRSDARGEMLIGSGVKIAPDTPFLLGSISKSFTAMAVMQLVEQGEIDLNAGIATYLDVFGGKPSGTITIRQLLSHTSGYSTFQGNDTHIDLTWSRDELSQQVERIAHRTPAYVPGTVWEYSNANYEILGALIERVSGQDYAAYVSANILEPIGMDDSFVSDGEIHPEMARGHRPWFGTKLPLEDSKTERIMAPAGGVIASASDMARYLAVMMNGKDDVLSASSKAAMMRPASALSPFYGFGWFIDAGNGTVWHAGTSPGTEALATLMPARQKAVIVLVNAGSGIGFGETTALREGIAARALGLDFKGEEGRWQQKAVFIGLVLLPPAFLLSMVWAWLKREKLRAKTGPFGLFSLWFPLLSTFAMAVFLIYLVPSFSGVPMGTLLLFQPDLALTMIATAATGIAWALFRLGVAYAGKAVGRVTPPKPSKVRD
ncbi:MAG: beta-lactamase family protein [Alphaproteobacteria bacterium]|nr:beta-lactamase family protein [Alphaproteobacteria bacterium]